LHALRSLIPSPRITLSKWIETNIRYQHGMLSFRGVLRLEVA
jgi:hypothetical protein